MRTLLTLPLLLLVAGGLAGCFYSLDGSLVNKKRDSGVDVTLTDAVEEAASDATAPDLPPPAEAGPDLPPTEAGPDLAPTDAAGPD